MDHSKLGDVPLVLQTHWGTFVSYDHVSGQFVHKHIADCDLSLFFSEGKDAQANFNLQPAESVSNSQFASLGWTVEHDGDYVAFRSAKFYVSAEPTQQLSTRAVQRRAWELFRPVSLTQAILMRNRVAGRADPEDVPKWQRGFSIPSIIHQTFPNEYVPEAIQHNISELMSRNHKFSHRLWSDKDCLDFIYDAYGYEVLRQYLRINPQYGACRADLFRYLLLYKTGGVYLDIKSCIKKSISDILRDGDEYILSQWDNGPSGKYPNSGLHPELSHVLGGEYEQWYIIAAPGHPFLAAVIGQVLQNIASYDPTLDGVGKNGVLRLSGPIAYTKVIAALKERYRHRFIRTAEYDILYHSVPAYGLVFKNHYSMLDSPIVL